MGNIKKLHLPIFNSACHIKDIVISVYGQGNSLFKLYPTNNNEVDKNFPKFEEQHKKKGKNDN